MSKAILLDPDAYDALAQEKREDETFSEVIRSHFGVRTTAADLRRSASSLRLADETLDAIEDQVRSRGESPMRSVDV